MMAETITADQALERRIEATRLRMQGAWYAGRLDDARTHAEELRALVESRSARQVRRMERQKGLYRRCT